MKDKYKFYIIIGVLAMLLAWAGMRVCRIGDSFSKLEGQYAALKKIAATEHALHVQEIGKIEAEKKKLDESVKAATAKIEAKDKDVKKLGGKIAALEAEYVAIGGDKDGQIANLKAQIAAWSKRFTIAVSELEDKDKIIFNLKQKYDLQIEISLKWQADFEKQISLNKALEASVASLKGKLRTANFKSNLKTYLVVAAVGYVGYRELKEK